MKLDNERVNSIYQKLTGHPVSRGSWNVERRNFAQKIVYIDVACRAVLEAISAIENAQEGADISALERTVRTEFKFLDTLPE